MDNEFNFSDLNSFLKEWLKTNKEASESLNGYLNKLV